MPIYNEDVTRVATRIDAIWTSVLAQADADAFDFFILSDTRSDAIGAAEERAWRALVARHHADGRIFTAGACRTSAGRQATLPISCATGAAPTSTS